MSKTNKQKELTRGEFKSRKRMYKAKKNWVVASATIALGISALGFTSNVHAEAWQATTVEEMQQKLKAEDGQYTFQSGDTFYAIGNAINIKPEKLMEMNGFTQGTQYSVPIGTTIYWDGNHVTIKDENGNVVADKVVADTDKIDPSGTVAGQSTDTPKNLVVADTNGNITNTQNNNSSGTSSNSNTNKPNNSNNSGQGNTNKPNSSNNGGQGNKPVTPEKPVDKPADKPVDPVKPEVKKFAVTVIYKDTEGNILDKDADVSVEENQSFTATAKSFDGFTLIGNATQTVKVTADTTITFEYKANEITPPTPVEKFNVTVSFVDEDGNTIAEKQVNEVEKGTEFTATAKNIDGYTVKGEATQTVTVDGNKEVTFTYSKNAVTPPEVQKFDVTINFVDENGTVIADKDVVSVEEGQEYTATAKTVDGYTLQGDTTQTVTVDGNKTITFTYKKDEVTPPVAQKFDVTVTYKDTEGNILDTDQTVSVEEGASFTATAKNITGYTLQGNSTQTITVTGNTTLTFVYEKDETPVVVDKSELQTLVNNVQDTPKGNFTDDSYSLFETQLAVAKDVLADNTVTQAEVDQAKTNLQTAFDNLVEKPAPVEKFSVTVQHVSTDGTVLSTEAPVEVEKGQSFTANATTISGYTLQGNATQTVTVTGDTTLTFTYKANEVTPPVTDVSAVEAQIASQTMALINDYRNQNGLKSLRSQAQIQIAVNDRANEIVTDYSHNNTTGGMGMDDSKYGYNGMSTGENIGRYNNPSSLDYFIQNGASLAFNAWVNSPDHNAYLLASDITEGAVGIHLEDNGSGKYTMFSVFIGGLQDDEWGNDNSLGKSRSVESSETQAVAPQSASLETEETTEVPITETPEVAENSTVSTDTVEEAPAEKVNKDQLIEAYNVALGLNEHNYDIHTWSTLVIKIGNAKNIFDDVNSSQQQVDTATNNLINTINNM